MQPLIVLLTVPVGLAGALLTLYLAGESLNLIAVIGMVVMSGIVVNDAILKVDMMNRFCKGGESERGMGDVVKGELPLPDASAEGRNHETMKPRNHETMKPENHETMQPGNNATPSSLRAAIHGAGIRRLRPILMTSLTTMLALAPVLLSSGLGAELQRPLAWSVIGGLALGTVASLFFVPVLYALLTRRPLR